MLYLITEFTEWHAPCATRILHINTDVNYAYKTEIDKHFHTLFFIGVMVLCWLSHSTLHNASVHGSESSMIVLCYSV
jgi:hypothetical protein